MDVSSKISRLSRRNAEDYSTLADLLADLESLSQEIFVLTQNAEVIERYLRKRSPNLFAGFDKTGDHVTLRDSTLTGRSMSATMSMRESTSVATTHRGSTSSVSPALTSRSMMQPSSAVHRVNILYRLEMVERELDDVRMTMDKLRKRFESAKFHLQVEEDNLKLELEVIEDDSKTLETFVVDSSDKKTGRLFLDKYLRFLENELNSKDRDLRKMKLRIKTYQTEYSRLKSQQQQKLELRERLHPVDLQRLLIENQGQLELLEKKTKQLLDLKREIGKKGQNLVLIKSKLNDTVLSLRNVNQDIKQKEAKYAFTEAKKTQNVNDLMAAEVQNQSIKRLINTYKSPDVHSYLRMEVEIDELRREKDAWERRCRYQRQTLGLLEHQLKQVAPTDTQTRLRQKSSRSTKSVFSSRSAESILKRRETIPFPHCTPTTPL